ncbi:MAG TPA: metallopeptidase TldD-related protein [Enhygromyxa sp.]|nr:metallopeptidase TldD-related protein [Enhygromyxa sp.]
MATISERDAKTIVNTVLNAAMVPEVVVSVRHRSAGNLRFARNQATTEGDVETFEISVTASIQGRSATAVGNRTDKPALEALMAEAEELAALSPVDPEHMAPVGKSLYLQVAGHDKSTAKLDAKSRAAAVGKAIATADADDVELAGFFEHHEQSFAVATSAGAFGYWPSTAATMTTTCRTRDQSGSGWAGAENHRAADLDAEALTQLAAEKADISRAPQTLAPGKQLVILESQAVGDLLEFLIEALDARAADEGRSWFSHPDGGARIGEELFHTSITLRSNPADPQHPAAPFTAEGEAHKVVDWIRDGVLTSLPSSRYWFSQGAAKGASTSGGAALPEPSSVLLDGADVDLLELVRAIDRGVLVTRFWYNRTLDPRTILATGLTRDGTFLVEQGKITTAIKNFRYNESPVTMLQNVLALGRPQRIVTRGGRVMVVPPMVVKDFNFASLSDAV